MQKIAFCIGAQKAGTSWLFRCLQEHPEIAAAPSKEIHFFSKKYREDGIEEYLSRFPVHNDKICLEASVSYLTHTEAPARIKDAFPDVRLIAILRDPVERTFSAYLHYKNTGRLKEETLKEAIERYPELIEYSKYGAALERYYSLFKSSQILILKFEDIKKQPQAVIDAVCKHLSIEPFTPSLLTTKYHSSEARSSSLYMKIGRWYRKLNRSRMGRLIIGLGRRLGINHVRIDKTLRKFGKRKPEMQETEAKLVRSLLEIDQKKYEEIQTTHLEGSK